MTASNCIDQNARKQIKNLKFIDKAKFAHGDKYDYSKVDYQDNKTKVIIICKLHGEFQQQPNHHTAGHGCIVCSGKKKLTKQEFVKRSIEIHGNRYDYTESVYYKTTEKIKIKCLKHGFFEQVANSHLTGSGCPRCFHSSLSRDSYQKLCSEKHEGKSHLYIIRCFNALESFYKIGITSQGTKDRFSVKSKMPYEFEEIRFIEDRASLIWDLEKKIHKLLKSLKYSPKIGFAGMSECYKNDDIVVKQFDKVLTCLNA
ncbi:hypothetical protein ACG9X6_14105 [Acinetobacter guillouiae]|uniref:hypothetical protein n=1 Tax=Acinetobacter guillouiae TaxID=106649 RepID=UPI003AF7BE6E